VFRVLRINVKLNASVFIYFNANEEKVVLGTHDYSIRLWHAADLDQITKVSKGKLS
jgi:hypothetical protein